MMDLFPSEMCSMLTSPLQKKVSGQPPGGWTRCPIATGSRPGWIPMITLWVHRWDQRKVSEISKDKREKQHRHCRVKPENHKGKSASANDDAEGGSVGRTSQDPSLRHTAGTHPPAERCSCSVGASSFWPSSDWRTHFAACVLPLAASGGDWRLVCVPVLMKTGKYSRWPKMFFLCLLISVPVFMSSSSSKIQSTLLLPPEVPRTSLTETPPLFGLCFWTSWAPWLIFFLLHKTFIYFFAYFVHHQSCHSWVSSSLPVGAHTTQNSCLPCQLVVLWIKPQGYTAIEDQKAEIIFYWVHF